MSTTIRPRGGIAKDSTASSFDDEVSPRETPQRKEPQRVLTVEERLRSSLTICDAVRHVSLLADEPPAVAVRGFTPREVVKQIPVALDVLSVQLNAVSAALPSSSLNRLAPAQDGTRAPLGADRTGAHFPVRLSEIVRLVVGGNPYEVRALKLAEQQARAMATRQGLMWIGEENDRNPVSQAVESLATRIERAAGAASYRKAKREFRQLNGRDDVDRLSPAKAVLMLEEMWLCETRAAYYLGLARGWLAVWRALGGAR